jgi:hypothetical protein
LVSFQRIHFVGSDLSCAWTEVHQKRLMTSRTELIHRVSRIVLLAKNAFEFHYNFIIDKEGEKS